MRLKMIGWITLVSSVFVCHAVAQGTAQIAGTPTDAEYPFIAEATSNEVYVRSGRGPGFYHCGILSRGDKVTIVEEVSGWAKILPLAEHYSWIHKNYVRINPQTPTIGTVTGDNVRIWAGSDYIEPIRSSSMQTRLNTGEIVELFDLENAEIGDYYKIKPPSGAFLWVSSDALRYVGPARPAAPRARPEPQPAEPQEPVTLEERLGVTPAEPVPAPTPAPTPPPAAIPQPAAEEEDVEVKQPERFEPAQPSVEELRLRHSIFWQKCYELSQKINDELKKPLHQQDYSAYRQELQEMLDNPDAESAEVYVTFLLDRIDRFELAIGVTETLKLQDQRLDRLREQIAKAHQEKLDALPTPMVQPKYTGTLKPSLIFTGTPVHQRRYMLTDDAGRIRYYLFGAGPEIQSRLEQLVGSKITVQGEVISDPQALVTLISVSSIQMD